MLDQRYVCEHADEVTRAIAAKREKEIDIAGLCELDLERRRLEGEANDLRHEKKTLGAELHGRAKAGEDTTPLRERSAAIKSRQKEVEARLRKVSEAIRPLLLAIPNLPHADSPRGGEENNRTVREVGEPRVFDFEPRDHVALGERTAMVEASQRGVKLAGSGFVVLRGDGARLVRTLLGFMLDLHTKEHGYTEFSLPYLANRATMTGTGQLPKLEDDMYHVPREDFFLIPTAEVQLVNLHAGEILTGAELPLAYTACTPCFRREAGSYGRETRGLTRVHQFDKVEMVRFCKPEDSAAEHERLLGHAEEVLKRLELAYRVVELATGDLSFAAHRCYDLECYAPATKRWFEVSSVSNCTDFQARRANIRFKEGKEKPRFVHTLNGSGLAIPRVLLCLMETHQQPDGSILLPPALRHRFGGDRVPAKS